ncbi:MAG: type II CAAX endopeptidase family protein [Acidimicrobiia bacterium]
MAAGEYTLDPLADASGATRTAHHPALGRVVWRWCRWTRLPLTPGILVVAALTIVIDVVTAWDDISLGHLGRVSISPALPLGALLAFMVGVRRLGLDRANLLAWREFLVVSSAALVFGLLQYTVNLGGSREAFGLVLAALGEELVYRLAVLIIVGAACAALVGRNWRNAEDWGVGPGIVALLAAGLVFTLLPGHISQMSDGLHALPFACLGVVLGYAVLRTGALLPAAVVHALLNLATIAALEGQVSAGVRSLLAAFALVALVLATIVAGRRLGILRPVPMEDAT